MLAQRVRALPLALAASLLAACAEPQWARQTWPSEIPGQLAQPVGTAEALSLRVSARAITWAPEGIVVELALDYAGEAELVVDPGLVFLAYDGLEYAAVSGEQELALQNGDKRVIELRYSLGRALTGPGAALRLRGVRRDGEAVVEVAELPVPAMPAQARPH